MQFLARTFASFAVLCLAASGVFAQNPHTPPRARHVVARGPERNLTVLDSRSALQRRFDQAKFSFYDVGQGACGKVNVASDFIVALNSAQYGSGSYCFQTITITYGGKSTQAQIADECPGCPYAGLDLSRGLFDFFASESAGIIYGSWVFGGAAAVTSTQAPKTTQTPTSTWSPPPSSTQTSSSVVSSSASSSASASASASAQSSDAHRSAASSAAPTSTGVSMPTGALGQLNFAIVQFGNILIAGAEGQ